MIIQQTIIISLLVFAIHYTMLPGEIFGFVDKWWDRVWSKMVSKISRAYEKSKWRTLANLWEKIAEPVFRCPVCMAPWHGTYLYWLIPWHRIGLPAHSVIDWLIIIIAALGLNSIIVRIFPKDD